MSSKKDMRRPDLGKLMRLFPHDRLCAPQQTNPPSLRQTVIPYQEPSGKGESSDISSTLSSTLPMAAMFMRNRYVGWYVRNLQGGIASRKLAVASCGNPRQHPS